MASVILHLVAIERLAAEAARLPEPVARALLEDLPYARLGAVLLDGPGYQNFFGALNPFAQRGEPSHFNQLFHSRAPVHLGLKMAELAASGALVGREPALAFLSGYFVHLAIDRALRPFELKLVERLRKKEESEAHARARISWVEACRVLQHHFHQPMLGSGKLREFFHWSKASRLPFRGVGRGFYEIIRIASLATLEEAPTKGEVDSWLRGLQLYGWALSSPLGKRLAVPSFNHLPVREVLEGPDGSFIETFEAGLQSAREVLGRVSTYVDRVTFSPRARARFLESFNESPLVPCTT